MKKLKFSGLLLTALIAVSCSNDKKEPGDKKESASTEAKPVGGDNIISFTVDGKTVTSSGWTISRFDFGDGGAGTSVNVMSNMHEKPQTINININGEHTGTYPLESGLNTLKTQGVAYGSYTPDYLKDMNTRFAFQSGEFTIISIDTTAGLLNASFHGVARSTTGDSVIITDGKVINGRLKAGITKM